MATQAELKYTRRLRKGRAALWLIVFICVCTSACTPMSIWVASKDTEQVAPVLKLPPDYDPLQPQPPYSGPHPASLPIDTSRFEGPVRLGEVGPIDESLGPLQYPFACETEASGLGQPLVDNHDGIGTAVVVNGETVGYSKDCLIKTQAAYFFKAVGADRLRPLAEDTDPALIDKAEVDGRQVPFIVRLERGSINRFIYAIAVLADPATPLDEPSRALWNGKLVYYFRGGVGIGKRQGDVRPSSATRTRMAQLALGYAVAFSSGTQTSVHYNLWLSAQTAAMVKHQFVGLYGEPEYTVGVGGSGGAVQQLLVAQNEPGLLDALIPQYSYPDMVTQSIWAYDCELLEYYFDITASDQKRWQTQEQRTLVEGLSADSDATNLFNKVDFWSRIVSFRLPRLPGGATECSASWRGLTPLTNNPTYTHHSYRYAPAVHRGGRWSHWHDVKYIYGVDEDGYAYRTYDNVGVQYGLLALRAGEISPAEFLHLNANIGGWKSPKQMRQERFWVVNNHGGLGDVRLWSDQNMQKTPQEPVPLAVFNGTEEASKISPAPRTAGYIPAIQAAYRAGQVFVGEVDIPIVDMRHYLDDQLDMHHSFASLAARQRLLRGNGNLNNHLIWVAAPPFDPTVQAFALVDEWLTQGRPAAAVDRCWDSDGNQVAAGTHVWDGAWNGSPGGACLQRFPAYMSPRDAAGGPITGDVFKCHLQPVSVALSNGTYGAIDMKVHEQWLRQVFPDGVCDFTRGDMGRPDDLSINTSVVTVAN